MPCDWGLSPTGVSVPKRDKKYAGSDYVSSFGWQTIGRGFAAVTRVKPGCRWLINRFHSSLGAASDGTSSARDYPSSYHLSPKAWLADRLSASQPGIRSGSTRSTVMSSGNSMRV